MSLDTKHIVIVTHYYPPHVGGIEMVAQNQAEQLVKKGNIVAVVTSKTSRAEKSGMKGGVTVRRVPALNILEKHAVSFPIFSPSLIAVMFKEVHRADVVHIHDAFYISSWMATLAARVYHKPIVMTQHVDMIHHSSRIVMALQKITYATTGRFVFRSSKVILVINDRVRQFLISQGVPKNNIRSCVNGVDTMLFTPATKIERQQARQKLGLPTNKKIVLFIGRYVPKKGFKKVLDARDSAYELVFVGGTSPEKTYSNTHFFGIIPHHDLRDFYHAADVFVLPSRDEGFPLNVQEAMASGLPIITSFDEGYTSYRLDNELLMQLKQPTSKSVRNAVLSLLASPERMRKMSVYSRRYAENTFSLSKDVSDLNKLYDSFLTKNQSPSHQVLVTTSWDDSHKLDLRMATLLKKYNLNATFYVAPHNREWNEEDLLNAQQIKKLSQNFEIGSHTITHPRLPYLTEKEAIKEIASSKSELEKTTGKKVLSFCYPRGEYTSHQVQLVKSAGYSYARTVKRHSFQTGNKYEACTTIHAYKHWSDLWKIARFARFRPIRFLQFYLAWDNLAIAMFEQVIAQGGIYHLWGHSWEIDKNKDWDRLEKVFAAISGNKYAIYVTNRELL